MEQKKENISHDLKRYKEKLYERKEEGEHPKKNRLCKKKHLPSSLSSENFDTTGSPITDNEYEIDSDFSYNNEFQNSIIIEE